MQILAALDLVGVGLALPQERTSGSANVDGTALDALEGSWGIPLLQRSTRTASAFPA